jgi:hypothetical protein
MQFSSLSGSISTFQQQLIRSEDVSRRHITSSAKAQNLLIIVGIKRIWSRVAYHFGWVGTPSKRCAQGMGQQGVSVRRSHDDNCADCFKQQHTAFIQVTKQVVRTDDPDATEAENPSSLQGMGTDRT